MSPRVFCFGKVYSFQMRVSCCSFIYRIQYMHIFNWMTSWSFSNLKRKSRFQCKIKSFSFVGGLTGKGYFCHLNRWVDSYPSHLPALGIIITVLFEIQTGNSIPASNQTSGNTSAHESQTTGRLGNVFGLNDSKNNFFNFIVLRFSCYYFIYVVSLLCFSFTAIKLNSRKSCGSRSSLFFSPQVTQAHGLCHVPVS